MLNNRLDRSCSCDLFFVGGDEYEILERRVMGDDMRHIVNMLSKNCTCRQWQLDGVPCIHAMSAITQRGESLEQYCNLCYLVSTSRAIYEPIIHPLPDKRMWDHSPIIPLLPPRDWGPSGRPQVNKRKDPSEALVSLQSCQRCKHTVKCGLCGQFGHNRKTCKEPINASRNRFCF